MSNRLCRDVGHSWQNTTSDTFRKCNREECKAAQRFVNGQWADVARIVRKQKQEAFEFEKQTRSEPIQGILFQ